MSGGMGACTSRCVSTYELPPLQAAHIVLLPHQLGATDAAHPHLRSRIQHNTSPDWVHVWVPGVNVRKRTALPLTPQHSACMHGMCRAHKGGRSAQRSCIPPMQHAKVCAVCFHTCCSGVWGRTCLLGACLPQCARSARTRRTPWTPPPPHACCSQHTPESS